MRSPFSCNFKRHIWSHLGHNLQCDSNYHFISQLLFTTLCIQFTDAVIKVHIYRYFVRYRQKKKEILFDERRKRANRLILNKSPRPATEYICFQFIFPKGIAYLTLILLILVVHTYSHLTTSFS